MRSVKCRKLGRVGHLGVGIKRSCGGSCEGPKVELGVKAAYLQCASDESFCSDHWSREAQLPSYELCSVSMIIRINW